VLTLKDALDGATPEVKALFTDAEAQGWKVVRVTSDLEVRMACSCSKRHNKWFNARPATPGYEERYRLLLVRRTCWQEGGSE